MKLNKKNKIIPLLFYVILILLFILICTYLISYFYYKSYNININYDIIILFIQNIKMINIKLNNNKIHNYPNISEIRSVIPLNIFQTWETKDLPSNMQKCIDKIKEMNPEFKHYLFNDNDCIEFIKKHFNDSVVNAYNTLIPGAYKADLWRYCVLYIQGGIYLDIKYEAINDFKFMYLMDKEHYVIDYFGIYNGLMISKPNNKILLECIERIVDNVNKRIYPLSGSLTITGPGLLSNVYLSKFPLFKTFNEINNFDLVFSSFDITGKIIYNPSNAYIYYKNKLILKKYNEYRNDQDKLTKNHYSKLYDKKQIYVDYEGS